MVTYLQDDLPTFRDASHLKIEKNRKSRFIHFAIKTLIDTPRCEWKEIDNACQP